MTKIKNEDMSIREKLIYIIYSTKTIYLHCW